MLGTKTMIENVKIIGANQTIEIDRTKTVNYVLDTVFLGNKDTNYTLINTIDLLGVERDVWYKKLCDVEINGWAIEDYKDKESMTRRKVRLNRFIIPKTQMTLICDDGTPLPFWVTQSVRYGTTEQDNNSAFCKFQIVGLYARS
jgi:hypothetical protein